MVGRALHLPHRNRRPWFPYRFADGRTGRSCDILSPPGRGFPSDLPMVGPARVRRRAVRRGFPTDLPMVGPISTTVGGRSCRGFPTDLPMVGRQPKRTPDGSSRGFPTDLPMVGPLYRCRASITLPWFPYRFADEDHCNVTVWNCCDFRGNSPPKSPPDHLGSSDRLGFLCVSSINSVLPYCFSVP